MFAEVVMTVRGSVLYCIRAAELLATQGRFVLGSRCLERPDMRARYRSVNRLVHRAADLHQRRFRVGGFDDISALDRRSLLDPMLRKVARAGLKPQWQQDRLAAMKKVAVIRTGVWAGARGWFSQARLRGAPRQPRSEQRLRRLEKGALGRRARCSAWPRQPKPPTSSCWPSRARARKRRLRRAEQGSPERPCWTPRTRSPTPRQRTACSPTSRR